MSSWPRRTFDVTNDLRLDPKNVRLGLTLSSDPPQGDIIQDLFQSEGAFEILTSIVEVGFLTHELPVVLKEADQWIVVEGNRRTAALKTILNPYLVPGFQPRVARLLEDYPSAPRIKEVECIIAPDRDSANKLIATLHTATPRRRWKPLRQAEFFAAQIIAGKSAQELIDEYPGIDVAEFIQTAEMHKLLQSAKYDDEELERYVWRKNFPISTFARLYENPEFRELAKLEVDSHTGHVTLAGNRRQFDQLANKIVRDMKDERIDTRVLNKPSAKSYKEYVGELEGLAVKATKGNTAVSTLPSPPEPAPITQKSLKLDVTGLYAPANYPAVGRILQELSKLRYRDLPNATFDLIRTFLEKSIKAYAAGTGNPIQPSKPGAFVYLDGALAWLTEDVRAAGQPHKALLQPINKLRSNRSINQYQFTKEFLDAANHNHEIFVRHEEVKDLWDSILNILRYVLRKDASQ